MYSFRSQSGSAFAQSRIRRIAIPQGLDTCDARHGTYERKYPLLMHRAPSIGPAIGQPA
jgi:hypothetical protein